MSIYYNEIDRKAVAWLLELMKIGIIAAGDIDDRSIEDVRPDELMGYTQCHFFAGIGVWSYALRSAGWPDDRPVWTGSCPCQPFSSAGKRGGFADERHLWPAWYHLISQCRPLTVFGEQVASKDGLAWLDTVHADLEGAGYTVGADDLCAAGFGAPHIRQRLFFVADSSSARRFREVKKSKEYSREQTRVFLSCEDGRPSRMDNGISIGRREVWNNNGEYDREQLDTASCTDFMDNASGSRCKRNGLQTILREWQGNREDACTSGPGAACRMANTKHNVWRAKESWRKKEGRITDGGPCATNGFWRNAAWIPCRDGKARPVEPGTFPLAHGAAERVGRLRGYGNAIVAPVAIEFIKAYMEL